MAIDVIQYINANVTGKEGSAIVAVAALKIIPAFADRQRLEPTINQTITDTPLYNQYDQRF